MAQTSVVSSESRSSSRLHDEIARAVRTICQSYQRGCERYLGEKLWSLEIKNRREYQRNELSIPFYLNSVPEGKIACSGFSASPIQAVTRDLSDRGIGFQCDCPVLTNLLIAEFDAQKAGGIRLLLDLRWRRKRGAHLYLGGGQIIRVLKSHEFR